MSAVTPGDLQNMRLLLGISRDDMGRLLQAPPDEVRNLERSRTLFVYRGHYHMLSEMLEEVNRMIDDALDGPAPKYLFTFPNEDVLKIYEPALYEFFMFNSAHQMFVARLSDAWAVKGHHPNTLDLVPTQYEEFLNALGREDSPASREAWADAHMKTVNLIDGMPPRTRSIKPKKDGIQYLRMTSKQLSDDLHELKLSPKDFSMICGANEKRVVQWLQDKEEIPHHVAALLAAMKCGGLAAAMKVTQSAIVQKGG